MTAYGYTSGDPRKVDIAGDTMTGPLLLSEDPLVDAEAATKVYVDTHSGGGGGTPSNTVVVETSFGQNAIAGGASTFSRGDHTHGTPAVPTAVVPVSIQAFLTSGNITAANGTYTQIGSDLTIAAVVGDKLGVAFEALSEGPGSALQFDAATRNAGNSADVNYWSSGTGVSRAPGGIAAWYLEAFGTGKFNAPPGEAVYTVQAADVNAGIVRVRAYAFGTGSTRVIQANANYPFRWFLKNYGH